MFNTHMPSNGSGGFGGGDPSTPFLFVSVIGAGLGIVAFVGYIIYFSFF